jgi:hypothetical protein
VIICLRRRRPKRLEPRTRRNELHDGEAKKVKCRSRVRINAPHMRDIDVIDSEPRLMVAIRRSVWEAEGRPPSTGRTDELFEERKILTKIDTPRTSRRGRLALRPCSLRKWSLKKPSGGIA